MKQTFFDALKNNTPLQIVGTPTAYTAILAEKTGHKAIYVSGASLSASSYGLPDLGMTSLNDVLTDVDRITDVVETPLLVDIDTGWGVAFNISRTIKKMIKAGAAAIHIEDQVSQKRCGHRPNKELVSTEEMCNRIKAAVDGRTNDDFFIMARTDALEKESPETVIERMNKYLEAGADGIFAEAVTDISLYPKIKKEINAPLLANMTEFGKTKLYSKMELTQAGVDMILYPVSALRAMHQAALKVYDTIKTEGTQKSAVEMMQTRKSLYEYLEYHEYENKINQLFQQ